jgi:hypothetical protein
MTMKFSLFLFSSALILEANAASPTAAGGTWFASPGNGSFSLAAQSTCGSAAATSPDEEVRSPDGKRHILVRSTNDTVLAFAVDEAGKKFPVPTEAWPCPEIGWSSASDLFFVNYSDGGAVGAYHVGVYRLSRGRLAAIPLASGVQRDFLRRYPKCFSPEEPNIAGIAWANNGKRLLVAAEVLPHSNCDNMGTFMLYEVAVPSGTIMRRYAQIEAKKSFYHLLGPELRAADDGCFSEPGSCRIPMLHETKNRRDAH